MRVLVTRPPDDARETAALLDARGHTAIIAPLLGVHYHNGQPLHLEGVQAILATSANGVRAFARRSSRRDVPVFAVGMQTAQAARDAGFGDVRNADGNAADLARAAAGWAKPEAGALLHVAGAQAEGRLAAALAAAGFTVRTEILYDVPAAAELPDAARAAFPTLDAVLFFSARSAQVFVACVTRADLSCTHLTAFCISEAAARPLGALAFHAVRIAPHPSQSSLLDGLGPGRHTLPP
ncbi:MAG: uroporphyrinogen-III synthase [Rhizomicrobium sp.]